MSAKAFCSNVDNIFGGARKDAAAVSNCCCSVMCCTFLICMPPTLRPAQRCQALCFFCFLLFPNLHLSNQPIHAVLRWCIRVLVAHLQQSAQKCLWALPNRNHFAGGNTPQARLAAPARCVGLRHIRGINQRIQRLLRGLSQVNHVVPLARMSSSIASKVEAQTT